MKKNTTPSLAILGTGSDVGKSLIVAGLCRLFYRSGIRVAPFKAQNMSLNSFVTMDGGEMGRAQVLQAQACGIVPSVLMNPVLLKPENDCRSQVIVRGKIWQQTDARPYFSNPSCLWEVVQTSYDELAKMYEMIVIEGAGSAAEMNLRDRDIVNWPVVQMADASVILVADIDRGGVFAQVKGTLDLLAPEERQRVIGVVINKFRGDLSLFDEGIKILEERTGVPVLGVVPYLHNLELDQEDSLDRERFRLTPFRAETVNIAVVLIPHMSNFTDFNHLAAEADVALRYVTSPREIQGADIIILPGSKMTMSDLAYLRETGFEEVLLEHLQQQCEIVGVCGGFQMLGTELSDPYHVEMGDTIRGLGYLDVRTELRPYKTTNQVRARSQAGLLGRECLVEGYEIHMGTTFRGKTVLPCFQFLQGEVFSPSLSPLAREKNEDGAVRTDGLVWGTYIHGIFDQPEFRRQWLNRARGRKNLKKLDVEQSQNVSKRLANAIDRWADHVEMYLTIETIFAAIRENSSLNI